MEKPVSSSGCCVPKVQEGSDVKAGGGCCR
jgi:hypothetical protein